MPLDIDQSYYNTGTATVAANGMTVTGQGTLWRQAVRANDMFGTHVGMPTRIAAVVSDTQLTLAHPWKGPAQTAAAYEIQFTPYDVGYQAAVRQLLLAMASGNVEALGALEGQEDRFPIFVGPGQMDLAIITAFARTLLTSSNVSEVVANLALGFGWGANNTNVNVPGGSLNTLRVNGVYRALGETVGSPPGNGVWQVIHAGQAGNYAVQLAFQITSIAFPAVFVRVLNNGTWGAWNSLTDFQRELQTVNNFELGRLLTGDRVAYIDFHAQDGVDNSSRIIRNAGANGSLQIVNQGSGGIQLNATSGIASSVGVFGAPGIKFPAAQVASSDPNTLDDYEEGTFTPTLSFGGGTTGIAYNSRVGRYQKVGNTVTVWINIQLASKGSSADRKSGV